MSSPTQFYPGARFYKADLHIHTPASKKCWKGARDGKAMDRIFEKLVKEKIEVVSITDHNTVASIKTAKELGKKHAIVVFPGVEVSTKEGHVLALFDPRKPVSEIADWLASMRISGQRVGDAEIMAESPDQKPLSITDVFYLIDRAGGLAIAPHPNSTAGFLEVMKKKGQSRIQAYESPYLRGLEVKDPNDKTFLYASGKKSGYSKRYGCVVSSDAHSIADIGKSYCYIKLGDFAIAALRQVFYDPAMRIRFVDGWPPKPHSFIESLEVSQGFLKNIKFDFHPDMNCIVGGKAVGKSLLIELIRFAFGCESPIDETNDQSHDMISAKTCLGENGTVTLYVVTADGERYRVQRTFSKLDEGPEVYYEDTQTKAAESVDEIINVQIYSQNEVIRLGERLEALVDWLDGFLDLSSENREIENVAKEIKATLKQVDQKYAVAVELDDLNTEKADLEKKRALLKKKVGEPILKNFPSWLREKRFIGELEKALEELEQEYVSPLEELDLDEFLPAFKGDTPNVKEITKRRRAVLGLKSDFREAASKLKNAISTKKASLDKFQIQWEKDFAKAKAKYEKIVKSAGVKNASALTSELNKTIQAIEKVERKLKRSEAAADYLEELEKRLRMNLLPAYSDCYGKIFKKRLDKAREVTESLNSFVKIDLHQMRDRGIFRAQVDRLAKGSYLKKEERQVIVDAITPIELGRMILDRNIEGLFEKTKINKSKLETFVNNVWEQTVSEDEEYRPSLIYEIMLTELKDVVNVNLRVDEGNYKPMNELSGGSKCTAILSVALVEGSCPLVVDQPEDALDNPFVFEQIVKTVRKTKANRQYLFATHNPNVAVAGDAELIYCLKATATEGSIDKHGSVDEVSTRDKVVKNLEGGRSAFSLRRQKYDIHVKDPNAVVLDTD